MKKAIIILIIYPLFCSDCFSQNYVKDYFFWYDNNLSQVDSVSQTHRDSSAFCISLLANPTENIDKIIISLNSSLSAPAVTSSTINIISENGLSFELSSTGEKKYFNQPFQHKIILSNSEKAQIKFVSISTKNTDGTISTPLSHEVK